MEMICFLKNFPEIVMPLNAVLVNPIAPHVLVEREVVRRQSNSVYKPVPLHKQGRK